MPSSAVWSSIVVSSSVNPESSLFSHIEPTTLVVSNAQSGSSVDAPFTLQSSSTYLPSETSSEDVTSSATKKVLQSIFLSLGLVYAQDSSTGPYETPFSTLIPSTFLQSGLSVREELVFPSSHPLMTSEEGIFTSNPVPTLTLHNDQTMVLPLYAVSSEQMQNDMRTGSSMETISFKPSESNIYSAETSMFTEKVFLKESATGVLFTTFSSSPVVPLYSSVDASTYDMDLTNLVSTSLLENPTTTLLESYSNGLSAHIVSIADSSIYNPSLSEFIFSTTASVEMESFPTTSVPESTLEYSSFGSVNTMEAPAFVPTESVLYISEPMFPLEGSENISSPISTVFTLEPSSPLPSLSEEGFLTSLESHGPSVLLSQESSVMLATSELVLSSSVLDFSPTTESISFEGSGLMPWQTTITYPVASLSPTSSMDDIGKSSSVFSESSELLEPTSILQSESTILYTSSFNGATSPLLPLFPSTPLTTATPALFTYSLDSDNYSTVLVEETLRTTMAFSHSSIPDLSSSMSTSLLGMLDATSVFPQDSILQMPTQSLPTTVSMSPTHSIWSTQSIAFSPSSTESVFMEATSFIPTSPTNTSANTLGTVTKDINDTTENAIWSFTSEPTTNHNITTSNTVWTVTTERATNTSNTVANTLWTVNQELTTNGTGTTANTMGRATSEETTNTSVTTANTLWSVTREVTTSTTIANTVRTGTPERTTTASITTASTRSTPLTPPSGLTAVTSMTTTKQTLVCDVTNTDPYLVTAVLFQGANIEDVSESIKQTLRQQFNRSVELEVFHSSFPKLSFMVTSGPLVYTAIAVGNVLSVSSLLLGPSPSIRFLHTLLLGLDQRFQVQTVLQFVPRSVDVRLCTFSDQIQKGLTVALYEVRRQRQEDNNFTVQIVNITSSVSRELVWKAPVTVSYAVKDRSGFLNGSEVSEQLRNLSLVEFSFFLGFPVKQIAEPSRYPQLNVSPLLKDSWLRTVLLGVMEQRFRDEAFQMQMERKLALLISEASARKRRWKRASIAGANTVQVVNVSRLDGSDDPVQLIYFIEDQFGERFPASRASDLINEVNIQRAAIILGYRVQGVVAQPLDQALESDQQAQNLWIIVGVAVPVLVVTVIIVILYWKLCRTDKLDFQPDTMSNLQQRQKLQAPTVKGFDFAKQHLGQHNKDEVLVVHEPPPPVLHGPLKDSTPSENGDVPTPKSKGSTKPPKVGRHRGSRVTPSDAGSTASDASSGKESAEETSPRPSAPPRETKPRSTTNRELPALGSGNDQHSSASIFEHVDRMSRSSEASRRFPSKIQLIAMQPITAPPMHGLSMSEREVETNKINREIQTTLRHKSEIEHHRNKIRLRAKRKGHYEFPLVDVVGMTDTRERQRMYRKAQMQFDKILDPTCGIPTVFIEPRKSSRSRRSPKQRRRQQGSGSPPDADRDRLITTDSDGTYKRPPGVSNSAYVSDPDLPSDNPTPVSDLGKYAGSPPRAPPPAQYVAPQPSIEEVRQTMQSLLDDAFALVAPSNQMSGGQGSAQTGTAGQQPVSTTPARTGHGSALWGSAYPQQSTAFNRFGDYGMSQASAPSLMTRSPGFVSGFPTEMTQAESQQADTQYSARGMYSEEMPSVARPRPLGSTSGSAQIHQLTQVGIASRMGAQVTELPPNRVGQAPTAGSGWSTYYHPDEESPRNVPHRDPGHSHGHQDYGAPQMYPQNRGPARQPGSNSHHPPPICYPSGSAEDLHPGHSSASLIKAIREELLRLSQKHAVVPTYHS
ncbi:UPF0606 protein KIAA1549 homolog [Discoglossus pictus]